VAATEDVLGPLAAIAACPSSDFAFSTVSLTVNQNNNNKYEL
jgi:hypothetical protein